MIVDKNALLADLRQNIIEIIFTKIDGTNRVLRGTLQSRLLPSLPELTEEELKVKKPKKEKKENPDVFAVYDVEQKGWRSIRWDSIISVQFPPDSYL